MKEALKPNDFGEVDPARKAAFTKLINEYRRTLRERGASPEVLRRVERAFESSGGVLPTPPSRDATDDIADALGQFVGTP